jgi:hypothetical protein
MRAPRGGSGVSNGWRMHNRRMATWADVSRVAASLPETTEPTPRAWRVRKKLIVWQRPLRKADVEALGTDASELVTEAWLARAPKTLVRAFPSQDV